MFGLHQRHDFDNWLGFGLAPLRVALLLGPALVLVGEKDANFQRASHVMAAKLPRAERVEIAGAGHVVNLDEPAAFTAAVERFIRAQQAAS